MDDVVKLHAIYMRRGMRTRTVFGRKVVDPVSMRRNVSSRFSTKS